MYMTTLESTGIEDARPLQKLNHHRANLALLTSVLLAPVTCPRYLVHAL
jgi:hypothetical protein